MAGAQAIAAAGADVIVMDDGFQNPALKKTLSFLVLDGGAGLGNGRVIPAGPLREDWQDARARADAIVVIGESRRPLPPRRANCPCSGPPIRPLAGERFAGRPVLAFAGIGRPGKFFDSPGRLRAPNSWAAAPLPTTMSSRRRKSMPSAGKLRPSVPAWSPRPRMRPA